MQDRWRRRGNSRASVASPGKITGHCRNPSHVIDQFSLRFREAGSSLQHIQWSSLAGDSDDRPPALMRRHASKAA
jgi:hypothetical protein